MDSQPSIKTLIEQVSKAGSDLPADGSLQPEARIKLQEMVKQLGFALEIPFDTLNRLVFSVRPQVTR